MKSLKNLCEASLTQSLYEVSILGDIDDQIKAYDDSIPERIEKWIAENYNCYGVFKISDKPNKNGLYEVTAKSVEVKNKNITSLTNGLFEWKEINNNFICNGCKNLTSLEGAPKKVGGVFECIYCTSLESLKGAPEYVGKNFDCRRCTELKSLKGSSKEVGENFGCRLCTSLESLEGAPKKVGKDFDCCECSNLKSLEGAPKEVGRDFYCLYCDSLKTLKGAPKKVGGDFYCYYCKTQFFTKDIINVSDVKGKICV